MPDYRVLYYPYFEPKPTWLRSILLFVDGVNRIIPEGAHHNDSRQITELRETLSPDPALPISPITRDLWINQSNHRRMKRAFELIISNEMKKSKYRSKFLTQPETIPMEYDLIHRAKIPPEVLALLKQHKLLDLHHKKRTGSSENDDFLLIEKQAGGLIMSYIADRIARRQGIDAITDHKIGFLVTALENQEIAFEPPSGLAEGCLIAAIASCEIPGELRYLSIRSYKELRDSYADIREAFKRLSTEFAQTSRLNRIDNFTNFQSRLTNTIKDFVDEYEKFRSTRYAKRVKMWVPIGIGSLIGLATGLINPVVATLGKLAEITFQVVDKHVNREPRNADREHAFQMLCNLQKDIIKRSPIKSILHL